MARVRPTGMGRRALNLVGSSYRALASAYHAVSDRAVDMYQNSPKFRAVANTGLIYGGVRALSAVSGIWSDDLEGYIRAVAPVAAGYNAVRAVHNDEVCTNPIVRAVATVAVITGIGYDLAATLEDHWTQVETFRNIRNAYWDRIHVPLANHVTGQHDVKKNAALISGATTAVVEVAKLTKGIARHNP